MGIAVKQNWSQPVWRPGGDADEATGIVPGYVESDGAGGLRMLYYGLSRSSVTTGSLVFTAKYMECPDTADPTNWTNRATVSGFDGHIGVATKNGGGYWTLRHRRAGSPSVSHGDLMEAATLNGTWSQTTATVLGGAAGDFLHDTLNPVKGAFGALSQYLALIRPRGATGTSPRRLNRAITSLADLTDWTPDFKTASPDPQLDPREVPGMEPQEFYSAGAWYSGSTLYASLPVFNNYGSAPYRGEETVVQPELWKSTDDGVTWTPVFNRAAFIQRGPADAWDSGQIYTPAPVLVGSDWWFFYSGSKARHDEVGLDPATAPAGNQPITPSNAQLMGLAIWDGDETFDYF